MDDVMLERLIQRLAAETVYPPTPALRARVAAALAQSSATPVRTRLRERVVFAALALVALTTAAAIALPASRSAIADLFDVGGTKVERLPTPAPGMTPTALPSPDDPADSAAPVTLDDAGRLAGFAPELPSNAGSPRAVFLKTYGDNDHVVILRFDQYDLWEARTRDIRFGKGLPEGVVVVDTAVNGRPAYWIHGGPHVAYLFSENGTLPGSERTVVRDTLIWATDVALYRMETDLSLEGATIIAESLP